MLRIRNSTQFLVIIHVGGVRVGWIRPQRVAMIRGLATGYHRVYAHTQYGSTAWGPQEVWIPGTWSLSH